MSKHLTHSERMFSYIDVETALILFPYTQQQLRLLIHKSKIDREDFVNDALWLYEQAEELTERAWKKITDLRLAIFLLDPDITNHKCDEPLCEKCLIVKLIMRDQV